MKLLYIGNGAALPGVPARDLGAEEGRRYGLDLLLESGLYKLSEEPKKAEEQKKSKRLEAPSGDGGE